MTPTTCQICGRAIKAKSGLIAHHGYKQPWRGQGDGARTVSCPGARYLPYEVSRDRIPPVRADYEVQRVMVEGSITTWLAEPPAEIEVIVRDGWCREKSRFVRARPEGFDPQNLRGSTKVACQSRRSTAGSGTAFNDRRTHPNPPRRANSDHGRPRLRPVLQADPRRRLLDVREKLTQGSNLK